MAAPAGHGDGAALDDEPDTPHYWATGTHDPDRFYSAVREYGWDHTDHIRDDSGDLDTYEANHPY